MERKLESLKENIIGNLKTCNEYHKNDMSQSAKLTSVEVGIVLYDPHESYSKKYISGDLYVYKYEDSSNDKEIPNTEKALDVTVLIDKKYDVCVNIISYHKDKINDIIYIKDVDKKVTTLSGSILVENSLSNHNYEFKDIRLKETIVNDVLSKVADKTVEFTILSPDMEKAKSFAIELESAIEYEIEHLDMEKYTDTLESDDEFDEDYERSWGPRNEDTED